MLPSISHAAPAVYLSAKEFQFSQPPSLRILGLRPEQQVTVRLTAATGPTPITSDVEATADKSGRVLLSKETVENALFRAAPSETANQHAMEAYDSEQQWAERTRRWGVNILSGGNGVASARLVQRLLAEDADIQVVRDNGISGALFRPKQPRKPGCLMVIGGSDGGLGWQGTMARALANKGYCAFALAYFGEEGLPKSLSQIPLEYFSGALEWLSNQPGVDRRHLGLIGYSKGGEATLLLAASDPTIHLAAGLVPSAYVFQAIGGGQPKSSWTRAGMDIPFVPYDQSSTWREQRKPLATMYEDSLRTNSSSMAAATIPLERSRAAILLLGGDSDWSWPSGTMTRSIEDRLSQAKFNQPHKQVAYQHAGHSLAYPDYWAPIAVMPHGASESMIGTATARKAAWRELLDFLQANL
jgi:dienelactone hydrolase